MIVLFTSLVERMHGMVSGANPRAQLPSPTRRQVQLQRAAQASELALRRTFGDLRQLADDVLGPVDDRLVVFRLEPGEEQSQLTSVEFVCPDTRVVRGRGGDDRAAFTELHADLVWALGMVTGSGCPGGLVVAVDQQMVAGYPEAHCNHWDGAPTFTFTLERPGLLDDPAEDPYCCSDHLAPFLLDRYGLEEPSRRTRHDCDDA
jgi:hypothetical protein